MTLHIAYQNGTTNRAYFLRPLPQIRLEPLLDNKESRMVLQRPSRMDERDVVFSQNLNESLVHFEKREIAADAKVRAASELPDVGSALIAKFSGANSDIPDKDESPSASRLARTISRA